MLCILFDLVFGYIHRENRKNHRWMSFLMAVVTHSGSNQTHIT